MNRLTDNQCAQLAGIWDCDGHIGVTRRWRSGRPYYRQIVQISQAKRELLDWVVEIVGGGKVYTQRKDNVAHPNRLPMFHLRIPFSMVASFLRQVRPYLILKKRQADLVIEMCDGMTWNGRLLSDEERARREGIAAELSALNAPVDGIGKYSAGPRLEIVRKEAA